MVYILYQINERGYVFDMSPNKTWAIHFSLFPNVQKEEILFCRYNASSFEIFFNHDQVIGKCATNLFSRPRSAHFCDYWGTSVFQVPFSETQRYSPEGEYRLRGRDWTGFTWTWWHLFLFVFVLFVPMCILFGSIQQIQYFIQQMFALELVMVSSLQCPTNVVIIYFFHNNVQLY